MYAPSSIWPNSAKLILRNIVKAKDGYILEKVFYENENGEVIETKANKDNPNNNEFTKNCYCCAHNLMDCCLICSKVENTPSNEYSQTKYVYKCDAYEPVSPFNIIKSKEEMIEFIIKVENFFDCPEDYEAYFGFERRWDEETGDILETVKEYYDHNGKFENIPDRYPCIINFTIAYSH